MSESRLFTVRPLPVQLRNDLKDCFRVYLSASSLASLKLRSGDLCSLQLPDMPPRTAIAWAALENIQNTVVQTSKILQDCYGFKLGDKLIMKRVDGQLEEADSVQLEECTDPSRLSIYGLLPSPEKDHWEWCLEYPVSRCGILSAGLVFEMDLKGHRRSFKVVEILVRNRTGSNTIYQFSKISTISIRNQGILKHGIELQVQTSSLEGVSSQVRRINECLVDFNSNVQRLSMPSFYEHTCGILIYGPKGTGKTALLRQIEAAGWRQSFTIGSSTLHRNVEDGGAHLRRIFQAALLSQPSVIIIDQVEFIAPRRMSLETSSLAYVLCEGIETLRTAKVLVVAATRHPNDVDDSLRTPHRLAVEIELSVPTAEARSGILRAIRGSCGEPSDRLIDFIARKTHGYVGADLFALLQLTCRKARNRELSKGEPLENFDISVPEATSFEAPPQLNGASLLLRIQEKDILSAMQEIRPTAMREVFLETPKVKWSDIGGQHEIKKRLQNVVQRPLKFPDRMRRLNVNSKKGILLYGPPGCSKTLTVKALASESGLNFLAVKGAEILNMYIGESERILREIFQKARAASPSIIFFDEIDAIASKRSSTSHGSVNVLTTLLNEMDGIEELRNVLVIAATNKPEMLDPALMRPGRLDNILYIGLPDLETRTEILKIWTSKSVVHPEVDVNELAIKTEGYSGAEMVNICETAGEAVLDEEEAMGQPREIMWHHFEYALGQVKRQITGAILHEYERWQNSLMV